MNWFQNKWLKDIILNSEEKAYLCQKNWESIIPAPLDLDFKIKTILPVLNTVFVNIHARITIYVPNYAEFNFKYTWLNKIFL